VYRYDLHQFFLRWFNRAKDPRRGSKAVGPRLHQLSAAPGQGDLTK